MRRWRFAPTFARSTRTGGLAVGHTGRLMAMLKHSEEGLALARGIGNGRTYGFTNTYVKCGMNVYRHVPFVCV